jgi:hypothetical protein
VTPQGKLAEGVLRGDSGQKTLGTFLVQNMLLWIVPAAEGKDLAGFVRPVASSIAFFRRPKKA